MNRLKILLILAFTSTLFSVAQVKYEVIYSEKLGLLFQITDDILDVVGDEEKLGKAVGSDDQLNKSTYPKILGLSGAKKEAEKIFTEAQKSLNVFEGKATKLNELAKYVLNRDH